MEILPIWLRDTFARIETTSVYEYKGLLEGTDDEPRNNITFITTDNIFAYCSNNKIYSGIVTIVISNLRDLYWNNRNNLSREKIRKLSIEMEEPPAKFRSIDDGKYRLFGNVTPYDVTHIPVTYFIESLNRKIPIEIMLDGTNTIIRFDYLDYDFWDGETQKLINYIPESW